MISVHHQHHSYASMLIFLVVFNILSFRIPFVNYKLYVPGSLTEQFYLSSPFPGRFAFCFLLHMLNSEDAGCNEWSECTRNTNKWDSPLSHFRRSRSLPPICSFVAGRCRRVDGCSKSHTHVDGAHMYNTHVHMVCRKFIQAKDIESKLNGRTASDNKWNLLSSFLAKKKCTVQSGNLCIAASGDSAGNRQEAKCQMYQCIGLHRNTCVVRQCTHV